MLFLISLRLLVLITVLHKPKPYSVGRSILCETICLGCNVSMLDLPFRVLSGVCYLLVFSTYSNVHQLSVKPVVEEERIIKTLEISPVLLLRSFILNTLTVFLFRSEAWCFTELSIVFGHFTLVKTLAHLANTQKCK